MEMASSIGTKKVGEKKQFKTIVVVNLQNELLDKELLLRHFSKYGTIVKSSLSLKNKHAIISFSQPSEAKAAKEQGTTIAPNIPNLVIYYQQKDLEGGASARAVAPRPLLKRTTAVASSARLTNLMPPPPNPVTLTASPTKSKPALAPSKPRQSTGETTIYAFYPDSTEAKELFTKRAVTAEERYRILEARDKIIRAKFPKVKMRVECAVKLHGTCRDMCPEKERYMREVQRQLATYEWAAGRDCEVDHRLAVKAYARSSADQEEPLPHELRPTETLEMSMAYMLHNIIPRQDMQGEDLANWYNFVWDRTRSIRKDITQQQLFDQRAVAMMEKCARFHIHCSSRLCELDRHAFDAKLNDENLMKCLQSLEHMYTDLKLMGRSCPNEAEFRAYQIMMNLNEGDILWEIQQKPERILRSPEVQFAIKIHMAMFEKNYAQFFNLVRRAPYLTACILHRYFFQVRSTALRTIFKAYSAPKSVTENYTSLSAVHRSLGFSDEKPEQFQYFCSSHGIHCDFERDRIMLNRKTFEMPDFPTIAREHHLIESKLDSALNEILNGGPLGKNPYPDHRPHSSFDDQGYLIAGDLTGVPEGTVPIKSETLVKAITTTVAPPATTGSGQLSSFSWSLPVSTATLPTKITPPSVVSTPVVKSEGSSIFSSFTSSAFQPQFGAAPSTGSIFGTGIFGGGGIGPVPPPVQPPSSKPSLFGSFPVPPPQQQPSPEVLREQKLKSVSEKVFQSILDSKIRKLCEDCYLSERERRQRELQRHAILNRVTASVYARLEQSVIENEVRMFWGRRRQIQLLVETKGKQICEELYRKVNSEKVKAISTACYQEAMKEREAKLAKLRELTSRIRVRFWVAKWKAYAEKKKSERERLLEEKIKELENFPSYQNTYLLSSEEILQSWCGEGPIPDRRKKSLCSPTRFFNWQGNPKISPSSPTKMMKKKENEGGEPSPKEPVAPRISEEQILRVVQLYDFPPSSNMNNTTTESVLSSWLGLRVQDSSTSSSPSQVPQAPVGGPELKRRRLDDEF